MLNKLFYILLLFIFPFYFFACSHTEPDSYDMGINKDSLTVEKLKYILNYKTDKIKTFEVEGDIEFESPKSGSSGSILLAVNKPDSLYAKIRGPFGITGAVMSINRDNFIYYNVQEAYAVKGSSTPQNISYILRIEIDFDLLISLTSGTYPFKNNGRTSDYFYKLKSLYYYSSFDSITGQTTKMSIDSNFNIQTISRYDSEGNKLVQIEYSEYKYLNGFYFPFSVYFNRINEKEHLWLKYKDFTSGINYIKYKVTIPQSVKIIQWE